MGWLAYLFVVAAGSFSAVQAGANAQLRKSLDQPLLAALCVYGTGLVALLIAVPFTRLTGFTLSKAAHAPWWAWLGGLLSIISTMAGLMLAKKWDQRFSPPQPLLARCSARCCSITSVGLDLKCTALIRGVWSDARC
jgi:Putative inner membrane exporter, YdcZ